VTAYGLPTPAAVPKCTQWIDGPGVLLRTAARGRNVSRFANESRTSRQVWPGHDSVIRRDIFSAQPPRGDYILSPTGLTWNIRRANDNGSVMSIGTERDWKTALATLLSLAEGDKADAWETAGTGSFRLIKRYRSSL
jgi:hypothetical protein